MKVCRQRADGFRREQSMREVLPRSGKGIQLFLRRDRLVGKAGEQNSRAIVARGDAAQAVYNGSVWLQKDKVCVFPC
ncbi:hypothetical protein SDC9_130704 [bioreactor metagenome]|uniref:Uncharacterized protein n=1 Tax=bioreactor metagenome TaxID=1076179 RepID=A0A645D390_9ZZZZ